MNATATKTATAKFSPNYVPAGTKMFVRKIGSKAAFKEHRSYTAVVVPTGTYFTRNENVCTPEGDTEFYQFSAMGYEIIVEEKFVTYDVIEAAVTAGACPKCDGTGSILAFRHVANGVCFWCKGKGK